MSERIFTAKEINGLLKNENVLRCSPKSITYNHAFKVRAVKQYEDECLGSKQIFEEAGFDLNMIGHDTPKTCLSRWRKTIKKRGGRDLLVEQRGKGAGIGRGRPRLKGMTDAEKIKRLELTVLYLKAENDFLAKLRAGLVE
jgi:hypothetical protein